MGPLDKLVSQISLLTGVKENKLQKKHNLKANNK